MIERRYTELLKVGLAVNKSAGSGTRPKLRIKVDNIGSVTSCKLGDELGFPALPDYVSFIESTAVNFAEIIFKRFIFFVRFAELINGNRSLL